MSIWWNKKNQRKQLDSSSSTESVASDKQSTTKTIEIKISIPRIPKSNSSTRIGRILSKIPRRLIIAIVIILVAIAVYGIYNLKNVASESTSETDEKLGIISQSGNLTTGTPDYDTVLPAGKKIEDYGGWTRVSPSSSDPVFAYVDQIGNVPINISQQPLPEDFKEDTEVQVEQLAIGFSANEKITVGDTIVHIGTSAKGPQSVIFSSDQTLVLIKSSAKISNDAWASYINSLE